MATASIHKGSYQSIPSDASPGLIWLKSFLPILDSLNSQDHTALHEYLGPTATFAINNGEPKLAEQVLPMLAMRSTMVSKFLHDVHTVWDVGKEDGRRTVLYESTSTTVFKNDEEGQEIKVKEFNIIELEKGDNDALAAVELRTYMDPSPVSARAQTVMAKKGE
jgi:hypothetical protein